MCCLHKRKQSNGYIWRYDGDDDIEYKKKNNKNKTPIIQLDKNGNFISEYESISEASKKIGISSSKICMCCKGKREYTKGYKFKYKKDYE